MGCLDDNLVVDFVEGRLAPEEREAAEEHLARCADCRQLIARTAEALLPTGMVSQDPLVLPAPLRGLHPGDVVGRYRVIERVGAGAMGVVYAAEDQELRRKVALKLLRADPSQSADSLAQRLRREARTASVIRHPNVVPVHDVLSLDDGSPVLVMDLLVGEPLRARLEREGSLDVEQTARILGPVLSALEAAHTLGVVHRDLKPDNIFLSTTDSGELDVKIVDFGVAKLTAMDGPAARSAGLTDSGALVGTPYYMSPEQAFGEKEIDARADLWAVGVILYECVTGKRPTEADNMGQVLKVLAHLSFPPIEEVAPDTPPRLAALSGRLLCERERRIGSAAEVRHELFAAAEDLRLGGSGARPHDTMDSTLRGAASTQTGRTSSRLAPALGASVAGVAVVGLVAFFSLRAPAPAAEPAAATSSSGSEAAPAPAPPEPPGSSISSAPSASVSAPPRVPAAVRAKPRTTRPAASKPVPSDEPRDAGRSDPTKLMMDPPF